MLRRRSTKSKQHRPLGRSKSTSCISQNHIIQLHSDPFAGQRDAHIAARLSYQRAYNRKSEGMAGLSREGSSPGLGTYDGQVSRHDFARSENARSQIDEGSGSRIARRHSVRFTGAGSRKKRALASEAMESRLKPTTVVGPRTPKVAEERAQSAATDNRDFSFSSSLNPLRLMQRSENLSYSADETNPTPLTDRRVRKSKSMFTALNAPELSDYFFSNSPAPSRHDPPPSRFASLNKENSPLVKSAAPDLRAPKSTSFLRNRRQNQNSQASSHAEQAVQLAREKFREQVEGQSGLKSHPSMFSGSRNRRTDSSMGFRKSLRNSSNNSAALSSTFSGDSLAVSKQGSLRKTARKVSSSIKTTLKGIFGRRRSGTSGSFTQGLAEAQDADEDSCLHVELPSGNGEASMSRGPSRMASIHAVPSPYKMKSLRGSFDSCVAEDEALKDDKSRVTSWTDSVDNTVSSHAGTVDWDRPRLSVIKENGLHISSSGPLPSLGSQDHAIGKAITVDSQRVYSALMKRAQEAKQREEEERRRSVDEIRSHGKAPPRSSSVEHNDGRPWSPPTIRCVQPEDDVFQDDPKEVFGLARESPQSVLRFSENTYQHMPSASGSPNPWSEGGLIDIEDPPDKASSPSRPDCCRVRTLTHRSSAFFASPSSHLFRTASPFRRALQESMKAEAVPRSTTTSYGWNTEYLGSLSAVSLPTHRPSPMRSEGTGPEQCTESAYSSEGEDGKPDPSLVAKFPEPPCAEQHGDATIFVSQPAKVGLRRPNRDVSTASSVEWKTWLSSHVSKLEKSGTDAKSMPWSSPDLFPRLGHKRENAEIESPTESTRSPFETTEPPSDNASLRSLTGNGKINSSQTHPILPRSATPGDENEAPSMSGHQKPASSYKRQSGQKGNFRSTPSLPILNRMPSGSTLSKDRAQLRPSASLNTLSHPSPRLKQELTRRRRARGRVIRDEGSSAKSSPGLTVAVDKQFGKIAPGSPAQHGRRSHHNTDSPSYARIENNPSFCTKETTKRDSQSTRSKEMVDSFLNSRRRKMEVHETEGGSSPAAFV